MMADDIAAWFAALLAGAEQREDAIEDAYQSLDNAGVLSKVTVHRYVCKRGCGVLGTVVKIGDDILLRTRDYKLGPGMNRDRSVAAARRKNTLDGDRHWPGHTFDVRDLAEWGEHAGMDMNCRHTTSVVKAAEVLATVDGVRPGHPGKPTLL